MKFTMVSIVASFTVLLALLILSFVFSPEHSDKVLGLVTPLMGILAMMLRTEWLAMQKSLEDAKKLAEQTKELKLSTAEEARKVTQKVQDKGTEVKQALNDSNEKRDKMLDSMEQKLVTTDKKLDTVVEQTNGQLDDKFKKQQEHITKAASEAAEKVIEAIPTVVKEPIAKVVEDKILPIIKESPNKS